LILVSSPGLTIKTRYCTQHQFSNPIKKPFSDTKTAELNSKTHKI